MAIELHKPDRFTEELHIIPKWAHVVAFIAFATAQVVLNVVVARDPHAPPWWGRILIGIFAGAVVAVYALLIGYVNADSKRRGMNRLLWTIVAICVPNGFGILLYFVLRQPAIGPCPHCGAVVQPGYIYCPKCSTRLQMTCPHCQREVRPGDAYCPYCGKSV